MAWRPREEAAKAAGYQPLPSGSGESRHHPPPSPPASQAHTALAIPSDREHAVASSLLAHACRDARQVLQELGSCTEGLDADEAAQRLRQWGPNVLASAGATPWYR